MWLLRPSRILLVADLRREINTGRIDARDFLKFGHEMFSRTILHQLFVPLAIVLAIRMRGLCSFAGSTRDHAPQQRDLSFEPAEMALWYPEDAISDGVNAFLFPGTASLARRLCAPCQRQSHLVASDRI